MSAPYTVAGIATTERLADDETRTLIHDRDSGDLIARVLAFAGISKVRVVVERELERREAPMICESCEDTGIYEEGSEWAPCSECERGREFIERLMTYRDEQRAQVLAEIEDAFLANWDEDDSPVDEAARHIAHGFPGSHAAWRGRVRGALSVALATMRSGLPERTQG